MSTQSGAEQLLLNNRMAVLKRQVEDLIEANMNIKAAVAVVDGRLTAVETVQKGVVSEVDGRVTAVETGRTTAAPQVDSRITELETSVHKLGAHFLRYQDNLVEILTKKFEVFLKKIQLQEDRIQAFVQEAVARTREQTMGKLDSTSASPRNGSATSNWHSSTPETASTTASEDSEKHVGELEKLVLEARKDFDLVNGDRLKAHVVSTEKRLALLKALSNHRESQGIANAAAESCAFEAKCKPPQSPSSSSLSSTPPKSLTWGVTQIVRMPAVRGSPIGSPIMPSPLQTSRSRTLSPNPNGLLHASPRRTL